MSIPTHSTRRSCILPSFLQKAKHVATLGIAILATSATLLAACGDDTDNNGSSEDQSQCPLYESINNTTEENADAWPIYDTKRPDVTFTNNKSEDGSTVIKFSPGKFSLDRPNESFAYFDFQNANFISISDKDAVSNNSSWDLAFRNTWIYSNGKPFPGNIEIARVNDPDFTYEKLTSKEQLSSESKLQNLTFVHEDPVDKSCKPNLVGTVVKTINSAFAQLHANDPFFGQYSWIDISPPNPKLREDSTFYIIRNNSEKWILKFQLLSVSKAEDKTVTLVFRYLVL